MSNVLRWYFLVFYGAGIVVLLVRVIPEGAKDSPIDARPRGGWAKASFLLLPLQWLVPPALILLELGQLNLETPAIRVLGVALSVYAALFFLWTPAVLGRFLVPYVAIFQDHELVTGGPFRFVRHPIYSANLSLFLGSGLGTLNLPVMLLWPLALAGFAYHARFEERFLREKFGSTYEAYAKRTGFLIPRLRTWR